MLSRKERLAKADDAGLGGRGGEGRLETRERRFVEGKCGERFQTEKGDF